MSYQSSPFPPLAPGREASYFYRARHLARRAPVLTTELTVEAIGAVDNLAAVFEQMKTENGPTPGPDGVTYPDLGRSELFSVLRPVSEAISKGTYRPAPGRKVKIPKAGGKSRTLTLRNLVDRIVAKALNVALSPFWENIFLDGSHGFRPKRSTLTMLATLEHAVTQQNRWVLVVDDIKAAFDSVNIDLVLNDHRRYLVNNTLLNLVDTVVHGGEPDRLTGIDQGCCYSPTALNVHLHHLLDTHMLGDPAHALGANPENRTPWLRYADNIVIPCQNVQEGQQSLHQVNSRLSAAGLALKGENGGQPVDLRRGNNIQLLGFVLYRKEGRLRFKLGPDAWNDLESALLRAHEASNPTFAARAAVRGWLASHGPAFHKRQDRTVSYVLRLASQMGFREVYSPDFLFSECNRAWERWRALVRSHGSLPRDVPA